MLTRLRLYSSSYRVDCVLELLGVATDCQSSRYRAFRLVACLSRQMSKQRQAYIHSTK